MSAEFTIETASGPVSLAKSGDGPDLIMLHSLLSDRHVFAPVVEELGRRWTVNLVDLPGFGSTQRVAPKIDAYADTIGALLDAGGYDPSATAILGNGLGAFVALGTAIRHGDAFNRLVVVGCGAAFPDGAKAGFHTMIERVEGGGMGAVVDVAVRRIFSEQFLGENPEALAQRADVLRSTNPSAFADACRALIDLNYRSEAGRVRNKTLIVVGTEDQATPVAMAEELDGILVDSRLVELDGIAHAPQLQDPVGFLTALEGFV